MPGHIFEQHVAVRGRTHDSLGGEIGARAGPHTLRFSLLTSTRLQILNLGDRCLNWFPSRNLLLSFAGFGRTISLDAEALEVKAHPISTPLKVPLPAIVYPSDVRPSAPLTVFNASGPREIYDSNGRKTTVRYDDGLPVEASRGDGTRLRIIRDALGTPAVLTDGIHSLAFNVNDESGLIVATDVNFKEEGFNVGTSFTAKTIVYPLSEREAIASTVIAHFATRSDDSWMKVED